MTQIHDVEVRTSAIVQVSLDTDELVTPEYTNEDKQFHPSSLRINYIREDDGSWWAYTIIARGLLLKKDGTPGVLDGKRTWSAGYDSHHLSTTTPAWAVELADRFTPQF